MPNHPLLVFLAALTLLLGGCTSFYPYKMDIRQGNYVTPEMRKKVKVGMTRQQVSAALGSPLVSDVFHANRWDYIYTFNEKSKVVEQQHLTVYFEGEYATRIVDDQAGVAIPGATENK